MGNSKDNRGLNTNSKILLGSIITFVIIGFLSVFFVPWKSDFRGISDYVYSGFLQAILGFIVGIVIGIILIILKKYLSFENIDILSKVKKILFSPKQFFNEIIKEKGIKQAFTYYFILSLVTLPFFLLSQYFILQKIKPEIIVSLAMVLLIVKYLINILIGIFIGAAIFHHIFVKNFGGAYGFEKTFQAIAYGMTPLILLEWVPYVNILTALYASILAVMGISKLQKIEIKKTTLMYIIFIIISGIITYLIKTT